MHIQQSLDIFLKQNIDFSFIFRSVIHPISISSTISSYSKSPISFTRLSELSLISVLNQNTVPIHILSSHHSLQELSSLCKASNAVLISSLTETLFMSIPGLVLPSDFFSSSKVPVYTSAVLCSVLGVQHEHLVYLGTVFHLVQLPEFCVATNELVVQGRTLEKFKSFKNLDDWSFVLIALSCFVVSIDLSLNDSQILNVLMEFLPGNLSVNFDFLTTIFNFFKSSDASLIASPKPSIFTACHHSLVNILNFSYYFHSPTVFDSNILGIIILPLRQAMFSLISTEDSIIDYSWSGSKLEKNSIGLIKNLYFEGSSFKNSAEEKLSLFLSLCGIPLDSDLFKIIKKMPAEFMPYICLVNYLKYVGHNVFSEVDLLSCVSMISFDAPRNLFGDLISTSLSSKQKRQVSIIDCTLHHFYLLAQFLQIFDNFQPWNSFRPCSFKNNNNSSFSPLVSCMFDLNLLERPVQVTPQSNQTKISNHFNRFDALL
ncbi:hypothetical protein GEMRC1_003216 [Eukaryota sp. GEM-RC1]